MPASSGLGDVAMRHLRVVCLPLSDFLFATAGVFSRSRLSVSFVPSRPPVRDHGRWASAVARPLLLPAATFRQWRT
jgi:hypothetical protein